MLLEKRSDVNPFRSLRDYEDFIYTLRQRYASIQRSTLIIVPRGKRVAVLRGELAFAEGYRITIQERLSFDTGSIVIEFYGYELWHGADKIAWYDAQPHPHHTTLADTHPHHKHVPPDIKHNRQLAPGMSFTQPNLPKLIQEIEELIEKTA
jgi:hypothetical protein